jgi:hypothetical protein
MASEVKLKNSDRFVIFSYYDREPIDPYDVAAMSKFRGLELTHSLYFSTSVYFKIFEKKNSIESYKDFCENISKFIMQGSCRKVCFEC